MRFASLWVLAACSAGTGIPTTPSATDRGAPVRVPATATSVISSNTTYAADSAPVPTTRPARTYELSAATVATLAKEKLRGQVLVGGPVFPTATAARGMVTTFDQTRPIAMRVVKDRGTIVEVSTAAGRDCVDGLGRPYELTVFVPRTSLVARTLAEVTRTFDDGTAYAIDRGAPVKLTAGTVAWFDAALDQLGAPPPPRLGYGLVKPYAPAAIPPAPSERLICDGSPMTEAQWLARKQDQQDRDARRTSAAMRQVAHARATKRASTTKPEGVEGLLDLALRDGMSGSSRIEGAARRELPYCSATTAPRAPARLGGEAYAWSAARDNEHVYRADVGYLADVSASCGRVRIAVDADAVKRVTPTEASVTAGARQRVWIPKPGPVFWPDGGRAGRYTGRGERLLRVTERDALICVDVGGVAEEVCHRRADVTVE